MLFLHELPELSTRALEGLRQPLENRQVVISRGRDARIPDELHIHSRHEPMSLRLLRRPDPRLHLLHSADLSVDICRYQASSVGAAASYGPLLDRINIHLEVPWGDAAP